MSASKHEEPQPLVSIVTPCLNAAQFIRQTVESVLSQDYPRIEYVVVDGGSTDGTIDILRGFDSRLRYIRDEDGGAAAAINLGFLQTGGPVFAWLNADDVYLPGAVRTATSTLLSTPDVSVVYGEGLWIDRDGNRIRRYPTVSPFRAAMLERECCICQPTTFLRRDAFQAVGMLDENLRCSFDYDLWIRLARDRNFIAVPEVLAGSRMHPANKSLRQRRLVFEETMQLLRRHFGYVPVQWVYGYLSFLRDGGDQYFEPLRHSALTYLASLPIGSYHNRGRMWRYWMEWSSHLSMHHLPWGTSGG